MSAEQEKRKFVRLNALVDVVYAKSPAAVKEEISLTKNISKGGICLIVYEELKENDLLNLRIFLPDDKVAINAVGRVVWIKEFIIGDNPESKRFDVGIEFVKINEDDLIRVNKYVFSHL